MRIPRIFPAIILLVLAGQAVDAGAQTLTNLWSFTGGNDGEQPYAGLVQGSDGEFYGTTFQGGAGGYGTVFRIDPSGTLTSLWSFTSGTDGTQPYAGLAAGSDGNFYGTTYAGGNTNLNGGAGYGTVFRMSPSGNLTNLHSFSGSDGASPYGGLVQGGDGNFYGTTSSGGAIGSGTVFRVSSSGNLTNLWAFTGGSDGNYPYGGLAQGLDGNFYGTTALGGAIGSGTVFRISASGSLTNLHSFNGSDGANPDAGVVQGADGNFYGTTRTGGASGSGTVFRVSSSGTLTTLWSFSGGTDGGIPYAGLVQGSDGNLYGTTRYGGSSPNCFRGCGTVFRISAGGSLTNLYSFNGNDGYYPYAGLVQGSDGSFYGTTAYGGDFFGGSVFRLIVPLSQPANQISAVQVVGTNILVTIPSVAGETYQLQFRSSLTSGSWANIAGVSVTNCVGGPLTLTNFGGALSPQGFYRFDITP